MAEDEIAELKNNRFPGLKCERKLVDKNIWLWSLRRSASKNDIQVFAKQAFKEAGIHDFKASDGWYRRWTGRWKKRYLNGNQNEKTALKQKRLSKKTDKKKADEPTETNPPPANNNNASCNSNEQIIEDLIPSNKISEQPEPENKDCNYRLKRKVQNETNVGKKKGERYLNHFKFMVASFAVENSIKDASLRYRVNKETVSYWIQDYLNKDNTDSNPPVETDESIDIKFIKWLREAIKTDQMLNKSTLIEQLNNLLLQNNIPSNSLKKQSWFHLYSKRLLEGDGQDKCRHIMYPELFKNEVASFARKYSKKSASRVFNIDRKRIFEWTQCDKDGPLDGDCGEALKRKSSSPQIHVTDKEIDKEVWLWYKQQKEKPSSKEVRERALLCYRRAGYSEMKCSEGWYCRWKVRYSIPGAKFNRQQLDNLLLTLLLKRIDSNLTISYSVVLDEAKTIQGNQFKPSLSWAVRFFKRNSLVLQKMLSRVSPLPDCLLDEASHYLNTILKSIGQNNLKLSNLATFDEIPLNFLSTGRKDKKSPLIPKSGFENCAATLIVCYFANGDLLPSTLILKDIIDAEPNLINVLYQQNGLNDNETMMKWFTHVLLNYIKEETLLICDSFGPHNKMKEMDGGGISSSNCQVSIIPPGCGSKLLPFAFGVRHLLQSKLESCISQWNFESVLPTGNLKYPTNKDLLNWAELIHSHIAASRNLLMESFREAGLIVE